MKHIAAYKNILGLNSEDEIFDYLLNNTKETIRGWDFFVDWNKVNRKITNIEASLNLWNVLVGKDNIIYEFKNLAKTYPEIVTLVPVLIALRANDIKVLDPLDKDFFNFNDYKFEIKPNYTDAEINQVAEFADKSGLFAMLSSQRIKNVVDYATGVEVGLDTNARKNRSGTAMENIVELFVKEICDHNQYTYLPQANANKIKKEFGFKIPIDKARRSFDFVINTNSKLYLIETNFYGGGGSKLKSVAGEFTTLHHLIKDNTPEHSFIWITDGIGWYTAKHPLREAFDATDFILNLNMVEKGILHYILTKGL
ncbi:MAG TPA: type II restriction endonuclease [Syntrophomonadaceae bacterium]|nr:type II restriction endonuclease [Syntrophomonadaceae bacterium]